VIVDRDIAVAAPPARAWEFLWSIDRLVRCLPGCGDVRTIVPHERYETVVREGVGLFTVQLPLSIRVLETEPPAGVRIEASGRDASLATGLSVVMDLRVAQSAEGAGSRLHIHAEIEIAGRLAALGAGLMQSKANGIVAKFAEELRRELEAGAA
jgi:carbon monoxide dehydrogenase subunit G